MPRARQPVELIIAKGKKHLTKEEIKQRREREPQPICDDMSPPEYLTKVQKAEFNKIAAQLTKLKIMGETDVDTLARYIVSRDMYIKITRTLRITTNPIMIDTLSKSHMRYFNQVRASANDLGLTISSRCKLIVPQMNEPEKKTNKFSRFKKGTDET